VSVIDAGSQGADAGASPLDAALPVADAGTNDTGAGSSHDAAFADSGDARVAVPVPLDPGLGGGAISAWPGDNDWDEDVDELLVGDAGGGLPRGGDSGCSVAVDARSKDVSGGIMLLGLTATLLRRRRRRV
jgi:MYXO-CTERM domain-containing protein